MLINHEVYIDLKPTKFINHICFCSTRPPRERAKSRREAVEYKHTQMKGGAWLLNVQRHAMLKTSFEEIENAVPKLSKLDRSLQGPARRLSDEAKAKQAAEQKNKEERKQKEAARAKREKEQHFNAWVGDKRDQLLAIQRKRKENMDRTLAPVAKAPNQMCFDQRDTDNQADAFVAWKKSKDDLRAEARLKAKEAQLKVKVAIKAHDLKARQKCFEYVDSESRGVKCYVCLLTRIPPLL